MTRPPTRGHKYGAKPTTYRGRHYPSQAQADYARRLDLEKSAGTVYDWWREVPIDLGEDGRYTVDFVVFEPVANGGKLLTPLVDVHAVDVKGVETTAFRKNKKLWKKYALFPLHIVKNGKTVEVVEPEGNP